MPKTVEQHRKEIRAERLRLEFDIKRLKKAEEALRKLHRPRPPRVKR